MPTDPVPPPEKNDAPAAETARQEGAQGRVGKAPRDKADNGAIDTSDPEMHAVKH